MACSTLAGSFCVSPVLSLSKKNSAGFRPTLARVSPLSLRPSAFSSCWEGRSHLGSAHFLRDKVNGAVCTSPSGRRGAVVTASLFGVGAPEALVIGVVALLVFGPKGLAEIARNLGNTLRTFQPTIRELQEVSREFRDTLQSEIGLDDLKNPPPAAPRPIPTPTPTAAATEGAASSAAAPLAAAVASNAVTDTATAAAAPAVSASSAETAAVAPEVSPPPPPPPAAAAADAAAADASASDPALPKELSAPKPQAYTAEELAAITSQQLFISEEAKQASEAAAWGGNPPVKSKSDVAN